MNDDHATGGPRFDLGHHTTSWLANTTLEAPTPCFTPISGMIALGLGLNRLNGEVQQTTQRNRSSRPAIRS
ncbi:hypothetical protein [Methylobacterium iners]|uniref:Uncharacterized protein n=1 Tax=Methylobacterium iners TaxID=418707 RepID=A0ABQ4S5D4_9HYPH|nr:hypothetical protein [Methylobacterium iners]GJD97612.1 hypothetical protein OCOJLMKI_4845 [Methylobacterium iners]